MRLEIIYFSGTGNTWWVVKRLAEKLHAGGAETRLVPFETREREEVPSPDADIFGVAFPCFGTGAPYNVDKFLHELPQGRGRKCFVLTSYALYNGSTAWDAVRVMKDRGYEPVLAGGVKMPMNIWLPGIKVWPIPKPARAEAIKKQALPAVERAADWLMEGKRVFLRRDPLNHLISRGQYMFYHTIMPYVNRSWSVDENCTRCGLCESICPRKNIEVTPDGVRFKGWCMLCVRCYSFCPEQAIQFAGKTRDYYRYPGVGDGYKPQVVEYA